MQIKLFEYTKLKEKADCWVLSLLSEMSIMVKETTKMNSFIGCLLHG